MFAQELRSYNGVAELLEEQLGVDRPEMIIDRDLTARSE